MYDLTIIGGGPAGTAAAITAARGGARVLLLEKGLFPRHKVCGEFVSSESLGLLRTLLDASHAPLLDHALRVSEARVYIDGRFLTTPVAPLAASIARLDLDATLWELAEQSGAEARQQTLALSISGEGPFRIATAAGEFESRAVLNASGRWSNLNAALSINRKPREKWLGLKAHFAEADPHASVDLYFFSGGYCGVQPIALRGEAGNHGRVNACAMVRADVASSLPEVFAQHPALFGRSRRWRLLSEPVSTSPLIFRHPQPLQDQVLLAGDAAGFVDPFVGDGISLALRSGSLAARCLIPFFRGEISLASATCQYQREYDKHLAPVFRASSKIRRMLLLPPAVRTPILFILQNTPSVTRYLVSKTR
jgi:flavin-dependent dehydrogenase